MPAAAAGIGFLVGLAVWFLAWTLLLPAGGVDDSLAQARELGLTSLTIREGYDKGQELRAWLLSLVLVPGGLWLGWKLATRSRGKDDFFKMSKISWATSAMDDTIKTLPTLMSDRCASLHPGSSTPTA